ncbi:hypothetical protein [Limnobacter sp.]|uniref:hypothetical protein n=1 Tax=Limnobacter sp. TaxID=2003368 RepID=UPI002FE29430
MTLHPSAPEKDTMEPIHAQGDWIVIRGEAAKEKPNMGEYFFVWVGDTPLEESFVSSAGLINDEKNKPEFPGYSATFHTDPSAGFVIQTQPNWDFETPAQIQSALDRVLWEVNRLSRL